MLLNHPIALESLRSQIPRTEGQGVPIRPVSHRGAVPTSSAHRDEIARHVVDLTGWQRATGAARLQTDLGLRPTPYSRDPRAADASGWQRLSRRSSTAVLVTNVSTVTTASGATAVQMGWIRGVDRAARNVGPGCDDGVMSLTASSGATGVRPVDRLEVLFEELAELTGQRNAIDGRIVEIVAELDRGGLVGITGARSVPALVAWKTGSSSTTAHTIATIASRLEQFPRCAAGLREGRLSLDQVGVIAGRAGVGSDAHYARAGPGGHGQPAAHRGQAGTPTPPRP